MTCGSSPGPGHTRPIWGEQYTIVGSPERIRALFDLSAGVLALAIDQNKKRGDFFVTRSRKNSVIDATRALARKRDN
jgi:hypothetical protein